MKFVLPMILLLLLLLGLQAASVQKRMMGSSLLMIHFIHVHLVEPAQIPGVCGSEAKAYFCIVQGIQACSFYVFSHKPQTLACF